MDEEQLIPPPEKPKSKYASPREFDEWKQIVIKDFEVLTVAEILARDGREPKYKPYDGKVRRLTFREADTLDMRILDINSPGFQADLSKYGIKKGDIGYLKVEKIMGVGKLKNRWIWREIDAPELIKDENS